MKCSGTKRDGQPCGAHAVIGTKLCAGHAGIIGGKTEGSGRPTKLNERELKRQEMLDRIDEAIAPLYAALQAVTATGEADWPVRLKAAMYLGDQALGKARQTTELTGADGGPITISELARRAQEADEE